MAAPTKAACAKILLANSEPNSSCQLGAVHTWGYSDRSIYAVRRRLRGVQNTGRVHGDAVIYWVAYCEL